MRISARLGDELELNQVSRSSSLAGRHFFDRGSSTNNLPLNAAESALPCHSAAAMAFRVSLNYISAQHKQI
jgi:hypothetical protein